MKKMNKKGFTLIEMLVVIAIIAVLVAIVIPTVTSATDKAAAATNAANLRSIKAEITTALLSNDTSKYAISIGESDNFYTVNLASSSIELPTAKKCKGVGDGAEIGVCITKNNEVTVFFVVSGESTAAAYTIDSFAAVAEGEATLTAWDVPTGFTVEVLEAAA